MSAPARGREAPMSPSIPNRVAGVEGAHAPCPLRARFPPSRRSAPPSPSRTGRGRRRRGRRCRTQTRFGLAPSSVIALIARGSEFHGVLGLPPRRKHPDPVLEEVVRDVPVYRLVGLSETPDAGACGDETRARRRAPRRAGHGGSPRRGRRGSCGCPWPPGQNPSSRRGRRPRASGRISCRSSPA